MKSVGSTFPLCINHNVNNSVTTVNKHNYSYLKDQLVHNYFKLHKHTKMANQAEFVKIVHLNHSVALVAL